MVRSFAALVFIGAVGAVGIVVATRPTIIRGDVIAAELRKKGMDNVECDPEIPLTATGADFHCAFTDQAGFRNRVHFKMNRSGHYAPEKQ